MPPLSRLILALLLLTAPPALAESPAISPPAEASLGQPLSPAEFAAYAEGRTLSYAAGGEIWGQEQYLPNRQVMWAFTGQECQFGYWYPQDDAVCFVYEGDETPKCWAFYKGPTGLIAELIGDTSLTPLSEVAQSSEPLACQGPQIGA